MIQRFYIHNFRCLENFELKLDGNSSTLLIGSNGTGKTTVGKALEVLQKIASGTNRVGDILRPKDLSRGREQTPLRLEIEVNLGTDVYTYTVVFEFPPGFMELRVAEEKLLVGGRQIFIRNHAQVQISKTERNAGAAFGIDWHLVALPIIQSASHNDHISIFKQWLANALILRPIPRLANGSSDSETLHPDPEVSNFGEWMSGLLVSEPSAYASIDSYLKSVMPDFQSVKNPTTGRDSRSIFVSFSSAQGSVEFPFQDLSDGEKCFMIFAMVIAANRAYGPLFCYWDEPDTHLAPSEVGHSIMALRQAFLERGQLLIASHNTEAIRHFSDENTLVLSRSNHCAPTRIRTVGEYQKAGDIQGNFINALLRGDLT